MKKSLMFLFVILICKSVVAVTCNTGYYVNNDVCVECPVEYQNTDPEASSINQCYATCTTANFNDLHIATVTGRDYYGIDDTCAIESCDVGYFFDPGNPDLKNEIGINGAGTSFGYINHNGVYSDGTGSTTQQTYDITDADTWGTYYGVGKGYITGKAICTNQKGYQNTVNNNDKSYDNPTTATDLTEDFIDGAHCWCKIDSYTPDAGQSKNIIALWVFRKSHSSAPECAKMCANGCASNMYYGSAKYLPFRSAMFNAVSASNGPSCVPCPINTYAGTVGSTSCVACPSGTFAPTGSAVCYPHILHVGNDNIYLKSTKQITPSLNIRIGNDVFYANMTTVRTRMNKDSSHYFHVQWDNNDYYVCDDTMCSGE